MPGFRVCLPGCTWLYTKAVRVRRSIHSQPASRSQPSESHGQMFGQFRPRAAPVRATTLSPKISLGPGAADLLPEQGLAPSLDQVR